MKAMSIRIFLILLILALIYPSSLIAATEQRIALVIGNSAYNYGPLKNPVNDATDMAAALKRAGFSVTLKKDANLREMMEAIEEFGNTLKKGGVGLFYYAGHGVQVSGVNYLLPISARINKEGDVRYEAVDAGRILTEMETANNGLNIVLLDACRDNPFGKSFRGASRGLAIVTNAPTGTFISYSTGAGQVARDGTGKNSPYTSAVLQYMQEPAVSITDVFIKVRQKLRKETGQVPWELSSLEDKFYFHPGTVTETATTAPSVDYAAEQRKIDEEKDSLRKDKAILEQQESIAEERRRLKEKKKQIATIEEPSSETKSDDTSIINLTGSGKKSTRPFKVEGPWELNWDAQGGYFAVVIYKANGSRVKLAAYRRGPGKGSSYQPQGGHYYLDIKASGNWQVKVIEVK